MAFIITVALLKGGVGKTTTAVALAETGALMGPAMLIDADPMGSAVYWHQQAAADGYPMRAAIVPTDPAQLERNPASLARTIAQAARQADVVVVDAPPPGRNAIAETATAASDVLVMPTTPSRQDLDRIDATRRMAADRDVAALAVLTMVRAGLPERDQAREWLSLNGIDTAATELPLSVNVQRNYGFPVTGPLARFGVDLLTELINRKADADADADAAHA
jgi:chromosome partitioning protein